jgi:hypothetical protein
MTAVSLQQVLPVSTSFTLKEVLSNNQYKVDRICLKRGGRIS